MENFVLYDEIGTGNNHIVYKGRRKETTQFVSIHCIEKSKRTLIQNDVRINHELQHENVVEFYDWYETTNHLWVVKELCTGDSLKNILVEDLYLPEQTIFSFGKNLVSGLFYLHSNDIIYVDLSPAKVLLDSSGVLKYSNFTLAKRLNTTDEVDSQDDVIKPYYLSPELICNDEMTLQTDLWCVGCVLYEMFTGSPPFQANSKEALHRAVLEQKPKYPVQGQNGTYIQASENLYMLIQGLLQKDMNQRIDWLELCLHPFWKGELNHLGDMIDNKSGSSLSEFPRRSLSTTNSVMSNSINSSQTISQKSFNDSVNLSLNKNKYLNFSLKDFDAKQKENKNSKSFDMLASSLPVPSSVSKLNSSSDSLVKESKLAWQDTPPQRAKMINLADINKESDEYSSDEQQSEASTIREEDINEEEEEEEDINEAELDGDSLQSSFSSLTKSDIVPSLVGGPNVNIIDLLFHSTDLVVMPLAENNKFLKWEPITLDSTDLGFQNIPAGELLKMTNENINDHLANCLLIYSSIKGDSADKKNLHQKLNILAYLHSVCKCDRVANVILEREYIKGLLNKLKETGCSFDVKIRTGRLLSVIASKATYIPLKFNMKEIFIVVTDQMKQNFLNVNFQRVYLPVVGEFLFYAATQEENENKEIPAWEPTGATFTIINRCLNQTNDNITQHLAAKIIDNVTTTTGRYCKKFLTNDTGLGLWNLYNHASNDFERLTASSALAHLSMHSSTVIQHVCNRAGFTHFQKALLTGTQKTQQSFYTMFVMLMSNPSHSKLMLQDKKFIQKICQDLDSSNYILRGKIYLLIADMCMRSTTVLLWVCQNRLLSITEKDARRFINVDKKENKEEIQYCQQCLMLMVNNIVNAIPMILTDFSHLLKDISCRHHPSSNQLKVLKTQVPLLSICLYMITNSFVRKILISSKMIQLVGTLFQQILKIKNCEINLSTPNTQPLAVSASTTVFSIVEAIAQHPVILLEYQMDILSTVVPALMAFSESETDDNISILSMKLFTDICIIYLERVSSEKESILSTDIKQVMEQFLDKTPTHLKSQEPIPSYTLKLLFAYSKHVQFTELLFEKNIISNILLMFQTLQDSQNNSILQNITGIINNVLSTKQNKYFTELMKNGLIEYLSNAFIEISNMLTKNDNALSFSTLILSLLHLLHQTLRHIEAAVKSVITSSKSSESATSAKSSTQISKSFTHDAVEQLLCDSKVLSNLNNFLINLLSYNDEDVADWATRCLYMTVELYGPDSDTPLDDDTAQLIYDALWDSSMQRQILLLRIMKRILASNQGLKESFVENLQVKELLESFTNFSDDNYLKKKIRDISVNLLKIYH